MRDTIFHRTVSFLVWALFLLGVALYGAPQLFGVTVYKLGLVFASASAGYWIDRVTFPYARPDQVVKGHLLWNDSRSNVNDVGASVINATMLRRAIIMAACMICVGLGA